jgi:hypothetical protein
MTADEVVTAYAALDPTRQIRVLADFAHRLTITARGTYIPGTQDVADPRRLRMLNEVQHRVTGHIRNLLAEDSRRSPDDVLAHIAMAEDDSELVSEMAAALGRCW